MQGMIYFSCIWKKRKQSNHCIIVFIYFSKKDTYNKPSPRVTHMHGDISKEEDTGLFPGQQV